MTEYVASQQTLHSESGSHCLDEIEDDAMTRYLGPTRTNRERAIGVGAIVESTSIRKKIIFERARHEAQTEMKVYSKGHYIRRKAIYETIFSVELILNQ